MNKAPFWYVVKTGAVYRHEVAGLPSSKQSFARVFFSRWRARNWATGQPWAEQARIVKVWARLPAPKLPSWVKPAALGARQFAVFTTKLDEVREYVFRIEENGQMWVFATHVHRSRASWSSGFVSCAPSVWLEAGLRAAALLRAEKRAGR